MSEKILGFKEKDTEIMKLIRLDFCINCKHEIGLFKYHTGNASWAHVSKKYDIVSEKCFFTNCNCTISAPKQSGVQKK